MYIIAYGMGSLHIWESVINAKQYIEVLQHHVINPDNLFQQDMDKHNSSCVEHEVVNMPLSHLLLNVLLAPISKWAYIFWKTIRFLEF